MVKTAVDMRRGDRNQPFGAQDARRLGDDADRHGGRRPIPAVSQGALVGGKFGHRNFALSEADEDNRCVP